MTLGDPLLKHCHCMLYTSVNSLKYFFIFSAACLLPMILLSSAAITTSHVVGLESVSQLCNTSDNFILLVLLVWATPLRKLWLKFSARPISFHWASAAPLNHEEKELSWVYLPTHYQTHSWPTCFLWNGHPLLKYRLITGLATKNEILTKLHKWINFSSYQLQT